MGFTNKLTGMLKKKGVKRRETVPFDSLDSYVYQIILEEEEKIAEESASYVEKILNCFEELSKFLERLKEMEREEMFKKLDNIVKNTQKRFANSLKNVVARIHVESTDYEGLKKFHNEVTDALQQIQKLNRIHGRYLHLAFGREMKTFAKIAKEIAIYNKLLGELLQSEESTFADLESIHEKFSVIKEMKKETGTDREEEIEKSIKTIEKNLIQLEKEASLLESSSEYQKVMNMEKQQKELSENLKSVEGEIYNILHPLDRDFRKFKRHVELGNFPFDLKLLEKYEHLTEQFLKEDEGYPHLKKIAEKMREALVKQVIKEKGRKKEKVMDILELILNDGLLTLQQQYHSLKTQMDAEPPDSDVLKKIKAAKREIEEKKDRIKGLKTKKENIISRKEDIRDNIHKIEEEIIEKCSEVGIQIE